MSELIQFELVKSKKYIHIDQTNINDPNLSWKAKGIFTYIMSRPENWEISSSDLINKSIDGKGALYSGLNELIAAGYIYRAVKRNEKSNIIKWLYVVFETPTNIEDAKKYVNSINNGWTLFLRKSGKYFSSSNLQVSNLQATNLSVSEKLETDTDINNNFINNDFINNNGEISSKEDICVSPGEKQSSSLFARNSINVNKSVQQLKLKRRAKNIKQKEALHTLTQSKKEDLSVSPIAKKIIDYWNTLGLRKTKENTKTLHSASTKILKLIRGNLFSDDDILSAKYHEATKKKFTIDEIKLAIYQFHLAALNSEYEPSGSYKQKLKSVNIDSFFYNLYSDNDHRSLFLKFFIEKAKLRGVNSKEEVKPKNETISNIIIDFYRKNVLGLTKAPLLLSDKNKLIEASNRLIDFFEENKKHIVGWAMATPADMAHLFCSAMEKVVENELNGDWTKLTAGYFKSDVTFLRRFPAYLNSQAAIKTKTNWSIYARDDEEENDRPYVFTGLNSFDPFADKEDMKSGENVI